MVTKSRFKKGRDKQRHLFSLAIVKRAPDKQPLIARPKYCSKSACLSTVLNRLEKLTEYGRFSQMRFEQLISGSLGRYPQYGIAVSMAPETARKDHTLASRCLVKSFKFTPSSSVALSVWRHQLRESF